MNGYLESNPKFNIGDLVVIDKKLYKSLTSKNFPAGVPVFALVIARRAHVDVQSHVVPASGNRFFDYKILLSGEVYWVYEDEISEIVFL
jgi:hypothetical protein